MSTRHFVGRVLAFLMLVFSLGALAQQAHQTSASIKQSKIANPAACRGRMNCINTEMRKAAAIRNADRRAKAQVQARSQNPSSTTHKSEVKQ